MKYGKSLSCLWQHLTISLLLVAMITLPTVGCSTAWVSEFDQYAAEISPAVNAVISILGLFGVSLPGGIGSKVGADVTSVTTLVTDFANASASAKPGVQGQLLAAESTMNQDLQILFSLAQVSDKNTQAKVSNLTALIESLVQAAEMAVPVAATSTAAMAKAPQTAGALVLAKNFSASFNAVLLAKTGHPAVDALTPKLRLHQHSKMLRIASVGLLK